MSIWLITFFVMLLVIFAMAVGVIFSNKPIKGSCGGLNNIGIDGECEICGGDTSKCEETEKSQAKLDVSLGYDASKK